MTLLNLNSLLIPEEKKWWSVGDADDESFFNPLNGDKSVEACNSDSFKIWFNEVNDLDILRLLKRGISPFADAIKVILKPLRAAKSG